MWDKLCGLVRKYWDLIVYLFFGGLTTVVDYIVYICFLWFTNIPASVCNVFSGVVAVIFAFVTNKPFVFNSHDWSAQTTLPELGKFVGARLFSLLVQTLIILLTVDILELDGEIMKIVTSVIVIILNYITSKLFVFRKKKEA